MKLLPFLLNLIAISAAAQPTISGRIIDSTTGQSLPGQYYYIYRDHDIFTDIEQADSNGYFRVTIEKKKYRPNSSYQVFVEKDGYKNAIAEAVPGSGEELRIFLVPDTNYFPPINRMIYKGGGLTWFGDYEPKQLESPDDIPVAIREKVVSYLINRLGTDFYSKLRLSAGQMVDLERLYKVHRNAKNYQWTPQSYYLIFSFRDTAAGIACYSFEIDMDKQGNIVEAPGMPDIRNDPSKGHIISMSRAKLIARPFENAKVSADFWYERDYDCFAWHISMSRENEDSSYTYKNVKVAAHNGLILEKSEGTSTREQRRALFNLYPMRLPTIKLK